MTSTQPTSTYITLNDVRIRYLDWGSEGLPPLVCLHGHTGQARIWDEFAEAMRESYHVYALDQRGSRGIGVRRRRIRARPLCRRPGRVR